MVRTSPFLSTTGRPASTSPAETVWLIGLTWLPGPAGPDVCPHDGPARVRVTLRLAVDACQGRRDRGSVQAGPAPPRAWVRQVRERLTGGARCPAGTRTRASSRRSRAAST